MISAGCANDVVLHPIEQTDIIRVEAGQAITAPKAGYFLSDMYVEKVARARVKSK